MEVRPGDRVRARGLLWDVLAADAANGRDRLLLRCADGDLAGLEWEMFSPPDTIEPMGAALDPRHPAPLFLWHTMHRAHALNALPGNAPFVTRAAPGRLRIEPYQLVPLLRALDMPRARLLLADGVGLGKTVQAGLIAAEWLARRRAHRILIVAPSGPLLAQWEQETRLRFGLRFTILASAAELRDIRRAHPLGVNPFDQVALCLTSPDFAKQDHVLEALERSAWDLVILDEAHHYMADSASGTAENTQRRRLAEVLARRSDALLLLTATPHDGDDARFASLIALLDPALVDGAGGFVGDAYRRHVIRRLKTHIRDPRTGAPLFRRRIVLPVKVDVSGPEHEPVRAFHRALAAFVVPRLRRREAGQDDALAFISLLKRSVSTIAACVATLRVVADRLARPGAETRAARAERARASRAWRRRVARFGGLNAAGEAGLDALEAESMAEMLRAGADAQFNTEADAGPDAPSSTGPDASPAAHPAAAHPAAALGQVIALGLAAEAHDPKLAALVLEARLIRMAHPRANLLIYTEYTDSQLAAARAMRAVGGEVLTIGGQDSDEARAAAAHRFAESDGLILISTDSLAEGLNLQARCFHLIHLDLPYNPNRLEQRNGRIDRYGQRREPEIRYLYLPGTFEESLLLHLISKYEKSRSALDVMPNTIGLTAGPEAYDQPLTGGLSEDPDDLFKNQMEAVRALDRSAEDSQPDQVAALLREIDRAFDSFDLMAVRHGWHAARALNADMPPAASAMAEHADLVDFMAAAIAAETGQKALTEHEIRLPPGWREGLEGLPGFDPARQALRYTRDPDTYRDPSGQSTAFLGRAHPLVTRAIRAGCRLPGAVSAARGEALGLLLTFALDIAAAHHVVSRRVIAILATPSHPPRAIGGWLSLGDPAHAVPADGLTDSPTDGPTDGLWDRHFLPWANAARADVEALATRMMAEEHEAALRRFTAWRDQETDRWRLWARARATVLCGAYIPPTGDLFGAQDSGPAWRREEDPWTRLIAFATDPAVPAARRREAEEPLEILRDARTAPVMPGPSAPRPLGLLMLVPDDGR